jgi:probable HAF family extracellular repeat protein
MEPTTGRKRDTLLCLMIITLLSITNLPAFAQEQDTKQSGPPHRYILTDLGTLGGTFSQAFGVNDKGWVVGFSTTEGDVGLHAFLWRHVVMTDFGTLGGSDSLPYSAAGSINNRGEIVGFSETSIADPSGENFCGDFLVCLPLVWRRGVITTLPIPGGNNGVAVDINGRGEVVGHTDGSQFDPACDPSFTGTPALWEKGRVHELPTIPGDHHGNVDSINDTGQASGFTFDCKTGSFHPVLWQNGRATAITGLEPVDINNRGEATGTGGDANGVQHAVVWRNGVTTILETLPDAAESHGNSINDKGQVTGQSCSANGWPDCTVFIWQNGIVRDLNALTTPGSSLFALDTGRMNARGQIVGFAGTDAGEGHAFLATPCDQENEEDEGCRTQEQSLSRLAVRPRTTIAVPERIQRLLQMGQTHPHAMSSRGNRLTK